MPFDDYGRLRLVEYNFFCAFSSTDRVAAEVAALNGKSAFGSVQTTRAGERTL